MTARQVDINNYVTIKKNPISRSGIFDYMGSSIGLNADPNTVYKVYRPAAELADPACIDSFKLVPIVDDHTMLGLKENGHTPAEEKGIHGVTGTDIAFEDGILYSDIRIYSQSLLDQIENQDKKDLSLGYRCIYEYAPGTFAGQPYTYVQRTLRGNHLALVDEARCDVSVLDHAISIGFDSVEISLSKKDFTAMNKEEIAKLVADTVNAAFDARDKKTKEAQDAAEATKAEAEAAEKAKKEQEEKDAAEAGKKDVETEDKNAKAMDSLKTALDSANKEIEALKSNPVTVKAVMDGIAKRDDLYARVSVHTGAFDHREMSQEDVAKYAAKNLGLDATEGHELSAVNAYIKAAGATSAADQAIFPTITGTGTDGKKDEIAEYAANGAKS